MALLENCDGQFVFTAGRHEGKTVQTVSREDPSYLTWCFKNAGESLADDAFHKLEDVMRRRKISFD